MDPAFVCATYALGRPVSVRRVARGAMGEVHLLTTTAGRFAVKEHFEPTAARHAEFAAGFADRCRRSGVRCPEQLRTPAGDLLVLDDAGAGLQVSQWVEGCPAPADDLDAAVWLGAQVGRIHALREAPDWPAQLDAFYARCDTDWSGLARCATVEGAPFAADLARLADSFAALAEWSRHAPTGALLISHNDATLANVVQQRSVRWLLDWDNVGPQDPIRELGVLLFSWRARPEAMAAMAAAYRIAGGVEIPWKGEMFASAVTIWLNFTTVLVRRALDREAPQHHRFAHQRLRHLLVDLPHPRDLDGLARRAELRSST